MIGMSHLICTLLFFAFVEGIHAQNCVLSLGDFSNIPEEIRTLRESVAALSERVESMDQSETIAALRQRVHTLEQGGAHTSLSVSSGRTGTSAPTTPSNAGGRPRRSCAGVLVDNRQCIRLGYTNPSYDIRRSEGSDICHRQNCTLADISSDAVYQQVVRYIRSTWNFLGRTHVLVWLGSNYVRPSRNSYQLITLTDGRRITLTSWYKGYPKQYSGRTLMALRVGTVATREANGIYNSYIYKQTNVPLCTCSV